MQHFCSSVDQAKNRLVAIDQRPDWNDIKFHEYIVVPTSDHVAQRIVMR